jgi:uncharacterized membrane protein YqhA
LGLAVAAAFFFIFGGIGLIRLLYELLLSAFGTAHEVVETGEHSIVFEVVEYVHTFLVGTVLYITAVGLFQLFIKEMDFPGWLKVTSTEELETNLIGVTVVVMAVNFMGEIFAGGTSNLLQYGAGIALPIAALGIFVGLRAWSVKIAKEAEPSNEGQSTVPAGISASLEASESE